MEESWEYTVWEVAFTWKESAQVVSCYILHLQLLIGCCIFHLYKSRTDDSIRSPCWLLVVWLFQRDIKPTSSCNWGIIIISFLFILFLCVCLIFFWFRFVVVQRQGQGQGQDQERQLLSISCFFVLVKFVSACFAVKQRVFLLHVGNGGLLQALWPVMQVIENDKSSEENSNSTSNQNAT